MTMRRFHLVRHEDPSNVSGTGVVAEGVQFTDGRVSIRWFGAHPSTTDWDSIDDAMATHGHGGKTVHRWLDPQHQAFITPYRQARTAGIKVPADALGHLREDG